MFRGPKTSGLDRLATGLRPARDRLATGLIGPGAEKCEFDGHIHGFRTVSLPRTHPNRPIWVPDCSHSTPVKGRRGSRSAEIFCAVSKDAQAEKQERDFPNRLLYWEVVVSKDLHLFKMLGPANTKRQAEGKGKFRGLPLNRTWSRLCTVDAARAPKESVILWP